MTDPTQPGPGEQPAPGYGQQQPQPGQPYAPAPPAQPLSPADDKLWASLAHFGNILSILPPLLIWLILKDRGQRVAHEGKEALNWAITVVIGYVVVFILNIIVTVVTLSGAYTVGSLLGLIVGLLAAALYVVNLIFAIMGGVKVNGGGSYRYPFALRLIK